MANPSPYFSVIDEKGVKVVTLSRADVVDGAYIERLGDDLQRYLDGMNPPQAVIDMESVTHLSSAALGMLVKLNVHVMRRQGGLRLAGVSKDLLKLFKMTKLHKILEIVDDVPTGVKELA